MVARDHQRVAAGGRVDVHEGDGALVLVDDRGRAARRRRSCRRGSRDRAGHGAEPTSGAGPAVDRRASARRPGMARLDDARHRGARGRGPPALAPGHRSSAPRRPTASAAAADWIADAAAREGCRDARVEEERAHGTYWWPLGLLTRSGAGVAGARRRRRRAAPLARWPRRRRSPTTSRGGRLWFRRRFLPPPLHLERRRRGRRPGRRATPSCSSPTTTPPTGGLIFDPALPALRRPSTSRSCSSAPTRPPPVMFPVVRRPAAGRASAR